jgi:hypothetical protein
MKSIKLTLAVFSVLVLTDPPAQSQIVTPGGGGGGGSYVPLSSLSASGGNNKVPQLDAAGNLNLSGLTLTGTAALLTNSLIIGPGGSGAVRLVMLNTDGNIGASDYWNELHSGMKERQINGDAIALCTEEHGSIQFGLQRTAASKGFGFMQARGTATAGTPTVKSYPLFFKGSSYYGGAAHATMTPGLGLTPVGDGTDNVYLDFWTAGAVPNLAGAEGTMPVVMRLTNDGLLLVDQDLSSADSAVSRVLGDARYKAQHSRRATDQTFTQSNVTPQDTGIEVALAVGTYRVEMFTNWTFTGTEGCRLKLAFSGTMAASGGSIYYTGGGTISSYSPVSLTSGIDGYTADITRTGVSTTQIVTNVVYTVTVAGTLKIQGAQSVSGATNTILKAGSYMIVTPL